MHSDSIDAEIAGHAHVLDMKLQSSCGNGFSLFAVRTAHVCQVLSLRSELINKHFEKTKF